MIEITRGNIRIDKDFELNRWWGPVSIVFYVECWFDTEKKFGVNLGDDEWINLYAFYNPLKDYLYVEYDIDSDTRCVSTHYEPTSTERETIISMLEECCKKETGMTCSEWLQKELKEK